MRPEYPLAAYRHEQEGEVLLSAVMLKDGTLGQVDVVRPRGFGFDEAAVEAPRQMRFAPARSSGEPVEVVARLEFTFCFRRPGGCR